jgi:hypothetical protein
MERCALVRLDKNLWRLFVSFVDPADRRWRIDALDAPSPTQFDPQKRKAALTAADASVEGVKDPIVYRLAGLWLMFVSFSPTPPNATEELRQKCTRREMFLPLGCQGAQLAWQ